MKQSPPPATALKPQLIAQRILEIFHSREGQVVSGGELSTTLNVSRTAIWKHIKSLQNLGYRISAVPSQGYRLISAPDILMPAEISARLGTRRIGTSIICYSETDSTNTIAFRLAEEGAPDGTVIMADSQRHGKGRLGREWESPPGVNLYCSVILRPAILPVDASQLTFLSAVAVARAVEGCGLSPRIKWPNDVLVNGNKVAGLLNEMSAEMEKVHFIILGIGVNINMRREQFPAELRHPASSLYIESGRMISRLAFVQSLLAALDSLYDAYLTEGDQAVRDEWLARSGMIGRKIEVSMPDRLMHGIVAGIDGNGALLLTLDDGSSEKVFSGDVTLCP